MSASTSIVVTDERRAALADLDVGQFAKINLIELHRRMFGRFGDGLRTPKADFVNRIMAADVNKRIDAILSMIADEELEVSFDDDDDGVVIEDGEVVDADVMPAPAKPGKPGKPGPAPKPTRPADAPAAAAALQAALKALGIDMPTGTELDEDRVREIAREEDAPLVDSIQNALATFEALDARITAIKPVTVERVIVVTPLGERKEIGGHLHEMFERIVQHISIRDNILLVGPSGSGKTAVARQAAEAVGLPFAFISCTGGMSESQLLGWLLPIGKAGKFEYVRSAFVKAYEEGGVFLLDEGDAADENVLLVINAALANGHMAVPTRYDNPVAIRHKDFVCIMAANTFGHGADRVYAGRNQLDGATLDRFRNAIVEVDYCPRLESALIDSEVLEWMLPIRETIATHKLRRVMSTRVGIGFTRQKDALKWGRKEWERSYFADWTKDERVKVGR